MDKYIIGNTKLNGYITIDYDDVAEVEINRCIVHYLVSDKNNGINHYSNIRRLILNQNDINLFIDESVLEHNINLCMLMASYQKYGVYKTISLENALNVEYLEAIEKMEPTVDEISKFIGNIVISYSEIGDVLISIQKIIEEEDLDKLIDFVSRNREVIIESTKVIDYVKFLLDDKFNKLEIESEDGDKVRKLLDSIDALEKELSEYKNKVGELEEDCNKQRELVDKTTEELMKTKEELDRANEEVKDLKESKEKAEKKLKELRDKVGTPVEDIDIKEVENKYKKQIDEYKKEIDCYKSKILSLEELISNSGPVLSHYNEIPLSSIKTKVKSVIYFKEISYVRYANSLIVNTVGIIEKIYKLKVKLLIYDYKSDFLNIYKPLEVVGSTEYVADRNRVVNKLDKMVVVDQQPGIIEDILRSDCDVIVIYDRLKRKNDILTGNTVYKYWIANSSQEITILHNSYNVELAHIITRPLVFQECLAIANIEGYKGKTPSAKLSEYMKLVNSGQNNRKLLDLIFTRTNIVSIKRVD